MRPPKTTEMKIRNGTDRARPDRVVTGVKLEATPAPIGIPKTDKKALDFYKFFSSELIKLDLLATTDILMLEIFCMELSLYFKYVIKTKTLIQKTADGKKRVNPLLKGRSDQVSKIAGLAKQLGLTIYARALVGQRAKLQGTENDIEEAIVDEFDNL